MKDITPGNNATLPAVPQDISPIQMMAMAVQNGAKVNTLEKLMDLAERMEANAARKAYAKAFAKFQASVPDIKKLKAGHNYKYAPLSDIANQIRGTLMECGLSYRFEFSTEGDDMSVTCIVSHEEGHEVRTTMHGHADDSKSGQMSGIQRLGSANTYMQRYTLIGALGLTTADEDMDARINDGPISDEQLKDLTGRMAKAKVNETKFLAYMGVTALAEISSADWAKADQAIKDQEKRVAAKAKPATKKEAPNADQ